MSVLSLFAVREIDFGLFFTASLCARHLGQDYPHHGIFVFPDRNAHFRGEQPRHLYSVQYSAQELWGRNASPRDSVHLDQWDSYLEHA
jgi:hypothetical protein